MDTYGKLQLFFGDGGRLKTYDGWWREHQNLAEFFICCRNFFHFFCKNFETQFSSFIFHCSVRNHQFYLKETINKATIWGLTYYRLLLNKSWLLPDFFRSSDDYISFMCIMWIATENPKGNTSSIKEKVRRNQQHLNKVTNWSTSVTKKSEKVRRCQKPFSKKTMRTQIRSTNFSWGLPFISSVDHGWIIDEIVRLMCDWT